MFQAIKSFKIENLSATKPRENNYGNLASYLQYDGKPFNLIMSVYTNAPFGVNVYGENKEDTRTEHILKISNFTKDKDDIETAKKFFDSFNELDEFMINFGVQHSEEIFGTQYNKDEVMKDFYSSPVKTDKDKDGNSYPPHLITKIRPYYKHPDRPAPEIFTTSKRNINDENFTYEDLIELVSKGSFVKVILKPNIWFRAKRMGVSWKVVQLKIMPNSKKTKLASYGFSDDSDDEVDEVDEGGSAACAGTDAVSSAVNTVEDSDEEEEVNTL